MSDDRYKWVALSNATLAVLLATLDASITLIAMPDIFRGIKLDPLVASNSLYLLWMILGYMVVVSVLVVSLGRLGDMFGRVRIYNLGFLIYTGVEWHKLIYEDHLTISTNLFGSTFYSLVGLHASHVVVGLILILMILIFNVTGRIKHYHHEHIIMISWYWHFVDAVWVVVFTVVYVIGGKS